MFIDNSVATSLVSPTLTDRQTMRPASYKCISIGLNVLVLMNQDELVKLFTMLLVTSLEQKIIVSKLVSVAANLYSNY